MEMENESLQERVADLEKKVLEQGDEIVCLRSTLADVLRRLNQFDSRGGGDFNRASVPVRNGNGTSSRGKWHEWYIFFVKLYGWQRKN
jgi:microtubule-associated protein-like 1/2